MIVSPSKMPSMSLPPLVSRKIFGRWAIRRVGFQPLHRAGGKDQHPVRGLAAQHLLPGEGGHVELVPGQVLREGRRGRVADRQAATACGDRVARGHAHARCGAVPGEHHVALPVERAEVHDLAIGRLVDPRVELELLHGIRHPARAEGLPGHHLDGARAQHRPHRHLDGAGVRGGHDADAVVVRHAQHLAGAVDGGLELGLAHARAVRAAQGRAHERLGGPCRGLGAGSAREAGIGRPAGRRRDRHRVLSFQIRAPRWGGVSHRRS